MCIYIIYNLGPRAGGDPDLGRVGPWPGPALGPALGRSGPTPGPGPGGTRRVGTGLGPGPEPGPGPGPGRASGTGASGTRASTYGTAYVEGTNSKANIWYIGPDLIPTIFFVNIKLFFLVYVVLNIKYEIQNI